MMRRAGRVFIRECFDMHRFVKTGFSLSALLAAVLALQACEPKPKPPPAGRADPVLAENYPRIVASGDLEKYLYFDAPIEDLGSSSQPMSVTVPVRSVEDSYSINVQYKFEFYDNRGQMLGDPGWRFMNMDPLIQTQMVGQALSTDARDWRLIVRVAK